MDLHTHGTDSGTFQLGVKEDGTVTTVCLSFDLDAMSVWISSFKQSTPCALSRGEYGVRVGLPRVLELLKVRTVPATFFVPGHTAKTFPEAVSAIANAGHEVAAHSFSHLPPDTQNRREELAELEACEQTLLEVTGVRPYGYRSPSWELSPNTLELLVERGYLYDSSLMADDYTLYAPRSGDSVRDDGSVTFGSPVPLLEFPVAWELDDFVYFALTRKTQGLRSPTEVGKIWFSEFEYCANYVDSGVFTLTMHPQVIGRGPRIQMLDNLIRNMQAHPDVVFSTMGEVARAAGKRNL